MKTSTQTANKTAIKTLVMMLVSATALGACSSHAGPPDYSPGINDPVVHHRPPVAPAAPIIAASRRTASRKPPVRIPPGSGITGRTVSTTCRKAWPRSVSALPPAAPIVPPRAAMAVTAMATTPRARLSPTG